MLKLINIKKSYEDKEVLKSINISFNNKGLYVIYGESGSGKSTLLDVICNTQNAQGTILYNGEEILKNDCYYRRNVVSYVNHDNNLFMDLSLKENLLINQVTEYEEYLDILNIRDLLDKKVRLMSAGEKQRSSFLVGITKKSTILVLDEPESNLDTENSERLMKIIKEIAKEKIVILVTHNKEHIEKYADNIFELNQGILNEIKTSNIINPLQVIENKKEKINFKMILTYIKKEMSNNKFMMIVTSFLLMIIYCLTIFISSLCVTNFVYEHYENLKDDYIVLPIVNSNENYVFDINSNNIFWDKTIVLEERKGIKVETIFFDEELNLNEIIITDYVAKQYIEYQSLDMIINKELIIFDDVFKIVSILETENIEKNDENLKYYYSSCLISDEYLKNYKKKESFSLGIKYENIIFGTFYVKRDKNLKNNEAILPSELEGKFNSNMVMLTTNLGYPINDFNFDIYIKGYSNSDIIYLSDELFSSLIYKVTSFGEYKLIEDLSFEEYEFMIRNDTFLLDEYNDNFILLTKILERKYILIIFMVLLIFIVKYIIDIITDEKMHKNIEDYKIIYNKGLIYNLSIINFVEHLMIIIVPLLITAIILLSVKPFIDINISSILFPNISLNIFIPIFILFLLLVIISVIKRYKNVEIN